MFEAYGHGVIASALRAIELRDYVACVCMRSYVWLFFLHAREGEREKERGGGAHLSHAGTLVLGRALSSYRIASRRYTSTRYEIRENVRDRAFENIRRAEADEWRRDAQHGEKLTSLGKSGAGKCAAGCGAK